MQGETTTEGLQRAGRPQGAGLRITRRFSREGEDVFGRFSYERRTSTIRQTDGSVVFELKNI